MALGSARFVGIGVDEHSGNGPVKSLREWISRRGSTRRKPALKACDRGANEVEEGADHDGKLDETRTVIRLDRPKTRG
jgi:hypothetical protein